VTTRGSGGDLGYIPRGVMSPALDEVAFSLQVGEYSGVISCETGLHIIQVTEVDARRTVSDAYWPAVQQRAFDDWLARRRAEATIVIRSAREGQTAAIGP